MLRSLCLLVHIYTYSKRDQSMHFSTSRHFRVIWLILLIYNALHIGLHINNIQNALITFIFLIFIRNGSFTRISCQNIGV
jgi:hypothetical protein